MKSTEGPIRFGEFSLDPANRQLVHGNKPIDLGGRYLDVLILLASAPGQLITKDRLHDQIWRGVPVTDEALSQAIMALRKALGDDASRPRFIETVPRHGYRFIGLIEPRAVASPSPPPVSRSTSHMLVGGMIGAVATGLAVGLLYGTLASGSSTGSAFSLVMVLISVSTLAAMVSGLGIAGGIALALQRGTGWWHPVLGGAFGGAAVGGFARLVGLDTLQLLMGTAPDRITGSLEGLVIGAIVGLGCALARRSNHPLGQLIPSALGAVTGPLVIIAGGTLMAGSLAALVQRFPGAGLSMTWTRDPALLGLSGAFETAMFAGLVSAGILMGERGAGS